MKRTIITIFAALLLISSMAYAQHGGLITTATPSTWWSNTGRLAPGAIGDTTPSRGTFSPSISKGPAIITSFAGTVSSSGATVTFSAAADAVLAGYLATNTASGLGTTIIAAAQTRYITAWLSSTQCTVSSAPSPAWGAGTAITSVQLPSSAEVTSAGVLKRWTDAAGDEHFSGSVAIGSTYYANSMDNAVTALTSGYRDVVLLPGTYALSSELILDGAILRGTPGRTIIQPEVGVSPAITLNSTTSYVSSPGSYAFPCGLYGITIDGSSTTGATGVLIGANGTVSSNVFIDNVIAHSFLGATAYGLHINNSVNTNITNTKIENNYINTYVYGPSNSLPTTTTISKCIFRSATKQGVFVKNAYGTILKSCIFEANGEEGLRAVTDAGGNIVLLKITDESWFEGNWQSNGGVGIDVYVDGSALGSTCQLQIQDAYFDSSAMDLRSATDILIDHIKCPASAGMVLIDTNCVGNVVNWDINNSGDPDTTITNNSTGVYINAPSDINSLVDNLLTAVSAWTDYTPTLTPFGDMTYTSTTINFSRYKIIGKTIYLDVSFTGTIGGTLTPGITVSLPATVTPKAVGIQSSISITDNGAVTNGYMSTGGGDGIYIYKIGGNWTAGVAGASISVMFEIQ